MESFSTKIYLFEINYIGIYTVCLPFIRLKAKNLSFKSKNITSTKFT